MLLRIVQKFPLLLLWLSLTGCGLSEQSRLPLPASPTPNIVIFYVDDLGYGDVGVYGAKGVDTPNIDALAQNGVRFTDAHSSSATCTPSRYSLLTGEYAFRNNAAVLKGDAPLIIPTQKPNLASLLKRAEYRTAVVGKWHLGLGDGNQAVDWNERVKPGPNELGFDYSFLLPSTGDRVPSVYMENGYVLNLTNTDPLSVSYTTKIGQRPTGTDNPEQLRQAADPQHSNSIINGISRIGFMQGGESAEWRDEDFYQVFTDKANQFIERNQASPFFLFFSFHDIHVPRLPNARFLGKSEMGLRGDAIVQMDWITGQIVEKLKQINQLDNTLIIFTSDNGPVLNDGYEDGAIEYLGEHEPAGIYRGGKYSAFEAGTRVPTILHYPEKAVTGISHALMSQIDLYASIAELLGLKLAEKEAIDSQAMLSGWLNQTQTGRQFLIEESYTLSLRDANWKYIEPTSNTHPWVSQTKGIEDGLSDKAQLFDLSADAQEKNNVAEQFPQRINAMQQKLHQIRQKSKRN